MEVNDSQQQYYFMVVDEQSAGPFTLEELLVHPALKPETLVWKPGIENWVAAHTFPELAPAFAPRVEPPFEPHYEPRQTPPEYNGPDNRFANNPQYRTDHSYDRYGRRDPYADQNPYYKQEPHYNRQYQNNYRPSFRTNWLPWAIIAAIAGFFTSCIGAIFGIVGIVQANKANTLYAQGFDREGDAANANARIMTIIGLILAGLGIICLLSLGNLSIFNSFY
ncbi:MAG: DUF4339 domain-containing protein [Muribaculaceae bacterium]|nr:DUF4339 domain-containing protein [Muribaculaceae bacterium]